MTEVFLDFFGVGVYNKHNGGVVMISEYSKLIYFSLGYSGLGSMIFLLLRLGLGYDVTMYPYQKWIMFIVAAIAMIGLVILLFFDIRRECECKLGIRLILMLAVIVITCRSFLQIWGFLVLYIGGF